MACIAALPLRSAALVPELLRIFMNTLFSITVACVVVGTLTSLVNTHGPSSVSGPAWISHYLFAIVPAFQWWLLRTVGLRVYANQRRQYEVQYDLESKEEQARALAESKIRFIAAAAHDLRQPVMALAIYADQLLQHPAEHVMLAPRIARASNAVVHLFDSLFDLANLDSGKVRLRIESVSVRDLLTELAHQFESVANAKAICLQVQYIDAIISTDAVRFRRMLANVISNAIKYSSSQTTVRIMATHFEDALRIEVADQGFGIPAAEQARVFEEFYRVSHPDHTREDGVGLGLSIVFRLAKLLQCEIDFKSVEGQGTQISFSVPYREDQQQGPQTSYGVG
ncbi:MAG: HAMP domain-containing histidine kinase [Alcaligenaceae bacterium]|nr:MAG: HAMP domain-containing histidine kinase [Alcaligenaceae bacterium]